MIRQISLEVGVKLDLVIKPIAFIESCYRDRFAVPRQPLLVEDAWSLVKMLPSVQPELSLQGLEGYSHLWVIFGFHLNQAETRFHAKVHPPRLGGESIGLFATRTPHRPNPLGLSLVKIKKITQNGVEVLGGDLADGTPVYDIKPYLPEIECISNAQGGWSAKVPDEKCPVRFESADLEAKVLAWGETVSDINIIRLITQTLENDPRPLVYRETGKGYKEIHAFRLYNGDIHFRKVDGEFVVCNLFIS